MLCLYMQECEYCRLYYALLNCVQLKDGTLKTDPEECIHCYDNSYTFEAVYSTLAHEGLRSGHLLHTFGQVLYTQFHGKALSLWPNYKLMPT